MIHETTQGRTLDLREVDDKKVIYHSPIEINKNASDHWEAFCYTWTDQDPYKHGRRISMGSKFYDHLKSKQNMTEERIKEILTKRMERSLSWYFRRTLIEIHSHESKSQTV